MICSECKKNFTQPLEYYDGVWACPKCFKPIKLTAQTLEVTPENNELYELSQVCYLRALKSTSVEEHDELITKAVQLCRSAAEKNHPLAIKQMGYYYDRDYLDLDQTELTRSRIASEYYSSICFSEQKSIAVSDPALASIDFDTLREQTAIMFVHMLQFIPSNMYKLLKLTNEKIQQLQLMSKEKIINDGSLTTLKKQKSEQLKHALSSCFSKHRAPVFGVYKEVELNDFQNLINDKEFLKMIKSGVGIYVLATKSIKNNSRNVFRRMGNENAIQRIVSEINADDKLYILLINEKGSHEYLKKQELAAIEKIIINSDFEPIERLIINSVDDSYVFYDDDLYRYLHHKRNVKNAIDELVDNIDKIDE